MTDDAQQPGACADPSCPVLHADPANPIHPPDYEPGGPMWDTQPKTSEVRESAQPKAEGA